MTTTTAADTFSYGHAAATSWRVAAEACLAQCSPGVRGATLGFAYATDAFAEQYDEIVAFLRRRTGIEHWAGTVGIGVCANGREYLDQPALALMCCAFDPRAFQVLASLTTPREVAQAKLEWEGGAANFAVLHGDPSNRHMTTLVRELAGRMQSGFVVGGLTSSRGKFGQYADLPTEGGVSGVLFSEEVVVATRLTQGCSPIGPKHRVSDARHNVLIRLDGRPALDVLKEDIGSAMAAKLPGIGGSIFAALPIEGSDTGDYVVRNLIGLDPLNKLVAIGEPVKPGAHVMFCRRDRAAAADDLERMLGSIKEGLFRPARGALYFSCLGRGASLFGDESEELRIVKEGLGDVPLVGFFCNGEISHNRLYGYTGVLTLFL